MREALESVGIFWKIFSLVKSMGTGSFNDDGPIGNEILVTNRTQPIGLGNLLTIEVRLWRYYDYKNLGNVDHFQIVEECLSLETEHNFFVPLSSSSSDLQKLIGKKMKGQTDKY